MVLPVRDDVRARRSGGLHVADGRDPTPVRTGGSGPARDIDPLHEAMLRAVDRLVALAGLVLAAPLLLLIAVAIKLDSQGPVFYRQLRVGEDRRNGAPASEGDEADRRTGDLGGRPFVIYKFRTMHVGAEDGRGPTWGSPDDERATRVGRFLRRHRLDELPQLWNVLRGDMSIVGPRPERPFILQQLRERIDGYCRRQVVRPGITGWAQINRPTDQSVGDVEQKLRYDLEYLQRRSLWFDAQIMLKTPLVMVRPDLVGEARPGGGQGGEVHDYPMIGSADDRAADRRQIEIPA